MSVQMSYLGTSVVKLLPAPQIAGLLPATISTPPSALLWPAYRTSAPRVLPTPEEIDLDIAQTFQRCLDRFREAMTDPVGMKG